MTHPHPSTSKRQASPHVPLPRNGLTCYPARHATNPGISLDHLLSLSFHLQTSNRSWRCLLLQSPQVGQLVSVLLQVTLISRRIIGITSSLASCVRCVPVYSLHGSHGDLTYTNLVTLPTLPSSLLHLKPFRSFLISLSTEAQTCNTTYRALGDGALALGPPLACGLHILQHSHNCLPSRHQARAPAVLSVCGAATRTGL